MEKCDRQKIRTQNKCDTQTLTPTDKVTTREACASKYLGEEFVVLPRNKYL